MGLVMPPGSELYDLLTIFLSTAGPAVLRKW